MVPPDITIAISYTLHWCYYAQFHSTYRSQYISVSHSL